MADHDIDPDPHAGRIPDRASRGRPEVTHGRVFVTGATGFLGRAVVLRLLRGGWEVTAAARDHGAAATQLGPDVALVPTSGSVEALGAAISGCDAFVNLAGEPIAGRWSDAKKSRILRSRIETTRRLVDALQSADAPPAVLVSASAVGWYGHRTDDVDEASEPGSGFLSEVCQRWEDEAGRARSQGARVVTLRFGLVLGHEGGALPPMLRVARLGLLGRLGTGDQAVAWIARDDAAGLVVRAVEDSRFDGPINAVAGHLPQREFAAEIARSVGRRTGPPVPSWAVRLALGEAASLLLDSSPALPRALDALGVELAFRAVGDALAQQRGGTERSKGSTAGS